ncbi:hypothetical protein J6590_033433 [Homalodisca vitripennis]|nr:hypothetical protein J6590_033433 [Homalodisca vitripennis]
MSGGRCFNTPSGSDVTAGGANSAHGHGPGTELAPPDYKGTDEDSGDDECGDPDRLARRLLMTEAEVQFAGKVNDDDNSESDQGMEETSHLPQESETTTSAAHLDYIHNQPQFSDQVEEPKSVPRELQNKAEEPLQDSTQQESFSTTSQVEVSHTPKRQKTYQTHQVQNATTFTKTSNTTNKKKKTLTKNQPFKTNTISSKQKLHETQTNIPKSKKTLERTWVQGDLKSKSTENTMRPPVTSLGKESHPLDFFKCFMTEDLAKEIVKYSVQCVQIDLMDVDKKTMMTRERGAYESYIDEKNQIVAVVWKDNSVVRMLSNEHGVEPLGEVKRYSSVVKNLSCYSTA